MRAAAWWIFGLGILVMLCTGVDGLVIAGAVLLGAERVAKR